jgi:hypothetical protein
MTVTLEDLRPRQRETVILLWNGLSPKQVAAAMHIARDTVDTYLGEVAQRLGGTCGPIQRIMLWQAELLRAGINPLNPSFSELNRPGAEPSLTVDAHAEPRPGESAMP